MPLPRRTSVLAAVLLVVSLGGCGGDPDKAGKAGEPAQGSSSSPSASSTPTAGTTTANTPSAGSTDPAASASASTSAGAAGTCADGTVPDGTWAGPVSMSVDGRGGNARFTSTKGKGTLTLTVAGGKVVRGSWTVTWTSAGHADTGQASADLKVTGTITGTAGGSASKPALTGTWGIDGTVTLTKPQTYTAPVKDGGPVATSLKVGAVSCTQVGATFRPTFDSKEAAATFTGRATWKATPR